MASNVLKFGTLTRSLFYTQSCSRLLPKVIASRYVTVSLPKLKQEEVEVTFVRANGTNIKAKCKVGDSLLDVVVNNSIDLDGYGESHRHKSVLYPPSSLSLNMLEALNSILEGACEGTLTCSTCHVILAKEDFDRLPEKPTDEELDMLDLAYDLSDTSRLGCQIIMTKELDGLKVRVPATVNDARSQ